jgi:hypothetical protein
VIQVKELPESVRLRGSSKLRRPTSVMHGIVRIASCRHSEVVKSPQTAIVGQEFGVFVEFFLIDGSKSFAEQRGPDRI